MTCKYSKNFYIGAITNKHFIMSFTKNILIVDDNSDDQALICRMFKRSNLSFIPTYASSLDEARQKLYERKFDVITLDGILSSFPFEEFGYQLISDIRKSNSRNAVIIMFSGDPAFLEQGLYNGVDYVYSKELFTMNMRFDEDFKLVPVLVSQWKISFCL